MLSDNEECFMCTWPAIKLTQRDMTISTTAFNHREWPPHPAAPTKLSDELLTTSIWQDYDFDVAGDKAPSVTATLLVPSVGKTVAHVEELLLLTL